MTILDQSDERISINVMTVVYYLPVECRSPVSNILLNVSTFVPK